MALVTTIDNSYQLEQLFNERGRGNHFSYYGYQALYDYLDQYSEYIREDFKVDVIALCCDFIEYDGWESLYNEYTYRYNNEEESWEDTDHEEFKQWVYDRTQVIECFAWQDKPAGVIIQCF